MSGSWGRIGSKGHGLVASAASVAEQANLMDLDGTAWHAVKYGEIQTIVKLFPRQAHPNAKLPNIYARGPMGENVFHIAMILNSPASRAIAKYLVHTYGKPLVNCPIQARTYESDPPGAYEGQTALHIAVINRDLDLVKFLVSNGADVRSRAWGPFFKLGGNMYYGEYVLSFAACTGQTEVVSHLIRTGAKVNTDKDVYGNTALHMCVYHTQKDMYDYLVETWGASEGVRNNQGLTPLVLAAHLGNVEMFQHIYGRRRRAFYTFGRFTSYSLALNEIDTVQDGHQYVPNAVETSVRRSHFKMVQEPLILTILKHKWETFARWQFIVHFILYLVYVVSQTFLIWLISSKEYWNSHYRASMEYMGFALSTVMLLIEVVDYGAIMNENYHRRLCEQVVRKYEPPLYPIQDRKPAEVQKPNLLQRLSLSLLGADIIKGSKGANTNSQDMGVQGVQPPSYGVSPLQNLSFNEDDYAGVELAQPTPRGPLANEAAQTRSSWQVAAKDQQMNSFVCSAPSGPSHDLPSFSTNLLDGSREGPAPNTVRSPFEHSMDVMEDVDFVSVGAGNPLLQGHPSQSTECSLDKTQGIQSRGHSALLDSGITTSLVGLTARQTSNAGGSVESDGPGKMLPTPSTTLPTLTSEISSTPSVMSSTPDAAAIRRQRTSARSSGGDLPPNVRAAYLKRRTESGQQLDGTLPRTSGGDESAVPVDDPPIRDTGRHVSHFRAFQESVRDGVIRIIEDPWLVIWHLHLVLTFVHFLTWVSTYHPAPGEGVLQFDDVVVSMMGLTGWLAVVYFFRGLRVTGRLAVTLERCMVAVAKWFCLYVLWNIGFTLGFYTLQKGATLTTLVLNNGEVEGVDRDEGPFESIGAGMASLVMFTYGNANQEQFCNLGDMTGAEVFCNIYFMLYLMTVYLLLSNLLLSLVLTAVRESKMISEMRWRHRWGIYILKAERRLPDWLKRRFRLGRRAQGPPGSPVTYSHVFEELDDTKEEGTRQDQELIDKLESLLTSLKDHQGRNPTRSTSGAT